MDKKIGILGYGEIGYGIGEFYVSPIQVKDKKKLGSVILKNNIKVEDFSSDLDVLHVCIPWSKGFIEIVKREIEESKAKLVFIHSTVKPGTIIQLGDNVVHAPNRSSHPDIYKQMKAFVQYVGFDNEKIGIEAGKYLEQEFGLKVKLVKNSINTELGKLLSTTYYGLCIAYHGEMQRLCDEYNADFDAVATDFNYTYNQGYAKLDKFHFIRPTLYPPEGGIGGTCVVPNCEILKEFFDSKVLDLVLEYKVKKE